MTGSSTGVSRAVRLGRSASRAGVAIALFGPLLALTLVAAAESPLLAQAVTLVTAFYAAVGATTAWLALRAAQVERRERNRPAVRVDFPTTSSSEVFLRIVNAGLGAASDVRVSFSPVPIDKKGRPVAELSLFSNPIPVLLPGQEIKHFFHVAFRLLNSDQPKAFDATVSYRDNEGETYSETWHVDLEVLRDVTLPRPTEAETLDKISKSLAEELKSISTTLRQIKERLDESRGAY